MDLSNLEPKFGGSVQSFIADLNKQYASQGLVFQPVSGYRSQQEQKKLYDAYAAGKARGLPDSALTKAAAPGQSFHNFGGAVDIMPFRNGVQLSNAEAIPILNTIGPTASKYGMTWGGAFDDRDHFQAAPHLGGWLDTSGRRNWQGPDTSGTPTTVNQPMKQLQGTGFNLVPELETAIQAAAAKNPGISADYLRTIAMIESNGGRNLASPLSSARGPFQFISSTAAKYGLTNPMDFNQSADAAARLALDNKGALERLLGRSVSDAELYLAHQQGTSGTHAILGNPDRLAKDLIGLKAVQNNIPKGSGYSANSITAKQLGDIWLSKYSSIAGGGGGSGATPAAAGGGGQTPSPAPEAAAPQPMSGLNPQATAAQMEASSIGQSLAALASPSPRPPEEPDQPAIRMPALDAAQTAQTPNPVPALYTGGISSQLAALGAQGAATGPSPPGGAPLMDPTASITQGAPGMTSLLDALGTSPDLLDPRRAASNVPGAKPMRLA